MKTRCTGMMFVVAENNEPSVQFYKRRGAEDLSQEEGWRLFRFDKDSLVKMASKPEEWQTSTDGEFVVWPDNFPLCSDEGRLVEVLLLKGEHDTKFISLCSLVLK